MDELLDGTLQTISDAIRTKQVKSVDVVRGGWIASKR